VKEKGVRCCIGWLAIQHVVLGIASVPLSGVRRPPSQTLRQKVHKLIREGARSGNETKRVQRPELYTRTPVFHSIVEGLHRRSYY
jgi:hypothetical protein